jgi:chemosensory pili system protein ChpC
MVDADQQAQSPVHCMLLPTEPVSLLVPSACIAEVIASPVLERSVDGTEYITGYTVWRGQRIPVISWEALHPGAVPDTERRPRVAVMNPTSDSAGSGYWAIHCYGDIEAAAIHLHTASCEPPAGMDERYIAMTVTLGDRLAVIPDMGAVALLLIDS